MTKRVLDILISFFGLIILSPIFVILYFKIKKNLGTPVIFKQVRPGLYGKPFKMYKFRTMKNSTDTHGIPLPDPERMTTFGNKLRSSSLDELPELWNVLKGNMSLVGPRPLLMDYLPLYNSEQMQRHNLRPGITGWAQINGRNAIDWDEKFKLDIWYVKNQSLFLDIKIIFLTLKKILIKEGITSEGHVTTEPFRGNKNND